MTLSRGIRRPFVRRPSLPLSPAHRPVNDWLQANQGFYGQYRDWLYASSHSPSTLNTYGVAARMVFSLVDKPYWQIDPVADLQVVREHIQSHYPSASTREMYRKGIAKLADYLYLRCHRPRPERQIPWATFTGMLPVPLAAHVRAYLTQCGRNWLPELHWERSCDLLSRLTQPLRWLTAHGGLACWSDLTPQRWFSYADARLAEGVSARTINACFGAVRGLLRWLVEQDEPVCERLLKLKPLDECTPLPRDLPPEQVRLLLHTIRAHAQATHHGVRRCGVMDMAWFLLMLHSGLRTGEIRRLRLGDIDWERATVRIERSKGLKDRLIPISSQAVKALEAYLPMRGPHDALPDQVFIYAHKPLSESYCYSRLHLYGERSSVRSTPHQLRHTCATLLLNAGAPMLTVQTILGHKHVDTTLGYARLYDGTVAADYFRAMASVEVALAVPGDSPSAPPSIGMLIALADSLHGGTLNEQQRETVSALRTGLMQLAQQESSDG